MESKVTLRRSLTVLLVVSLCLICFGQAPFGGSNSVFQTTPREDRLDLDITNREVTEVLKIISDAGGWTIVPSKGVTNNTRVSLWSKQATPRQLLDKLCVANNYIYQEDEGNVFFVMTREEYEQAFGSVTQTFVLNYQKAENIRALLESCLTRTGKMGVDPWSNTIVISDTKENLQKVEAVVARLDQGFVQKRFELTHARAGEVAQTVERIYPQEGSVQVNDSLPSRHGAGSTTIEPAG